jgi:hypothetical protein
MAHVQGLATATTSSVVHVPVEPNVWKVQQAELDELTGWLADRLRPDWPRLSYEGLYSWLRAAIVDRQSLLVRTVAVVGLFQAESPYALEPTGTFVRERWVRSKRARLRRGGRPLRPRPRLGARRPRLRPRVQRRQRRADAEIRRPRPDRHPPREPGA